MSTWFDEIGLVYAKKHDEVEAARLAFTSQRQRILDHLVDIASQGLAMASVEFQRGNVDGGWETIWVLGTHANARRKLANKEKYQSGICFGLDHDPYFVMNEGGCFGFGAYLFFAMGDGSYQGSKDKLAKVGLPTDYVYERKSRGAYLRSAWIVPTDERFSLQAFEQAVAALPKLFAGADGVVANAYTSHKG
jgi:hypothetical protein